MDKFFLMQIQRKNGEFTKGVVVHDTLDAARQGFYAYLGAYGYGHDATIDYVQAMVVDMTGRVRDGVVDNRIPRPEPEPPEPEAEE